MEQPIDKRKRKASHQISRKQTGHQFFGPLNPTHYPDNGGRPDVIDIAIAGSHRRQIEIWTIQEGASDYNPILLEYGDIIENDKEDIINKINWPKFQRKLNGNIRTTPAIEDKNEIEEAIRKLEEHVNKTLVESTSEIRRAKRNRYGEIPDRIKDLTR